MGLQICYIEISQEFDPAIETSLAGTWLHTKAHITARPGLRWAFLSIEIELWIEKEVSDATQAK